MSALRRPPWLINTLVGGFLLGIVGTVAQVAFVVWLVLSVVPARGAETRPFDWDRYHARQDACREADRLAQDCTRGLAYCDELALRQAKRACSAFGPLGERRP